MNGPSLSLSKAVLAFSAVLLLVSCADAPKLPEKQAPPLVFPGPPDEPRFYFERSIYSSADIIPEEEASRLRRVLTGERRSGEGLAKPYAVAVHKGTIFLSDSVERFVKAFDVPNGRYYPVGMEGQGALQKPLGIDVDDEGNLYVADATLKTVNVYSKSGKFLRSLGSKGTFERLASVTVEPSGDRLYAVDIAGISSDVHRVRVFNAKTGEHLFDIGKRGTGDGEFNLPRDVAIGKSGELFVVDGGNFRVQVFSREGKYLRSFGEVGRRPGQFSRPKEIASDAAGNVYVVDTAFGNFQIFDPTGQLLLFIGGRAERDGPGKYMLPSGIFVDEDGRIYMVDQWFRKVDVFRPASVKPEQGYLAIKPPVAKGTAAAPKAK